jgi:F-type H+-transporting ATPase subunit epsilon
MAELEVSVVAADREVWSGTAKQIVARTTVGEIGLLPGHQPVLAILGPGEVRVTLEDGSVVKANAEEGFLSFEHDTVTIVAQNAELVE